MPKQSLQLGYYPIRGKIQVSRLLCQYLSVKYNDRLFSILEWQKQKKEKLKGFALKQLPYLQEGDFRVTGSVPMCLYIIDRFSDGQLLGKSLKDKSIVDMYLWTIDSMNCIININCQKGKSEQELKQLKQMQWINLVAPKLQKYEQKANDNQWFLGYLTVIDFSIYELIRYMEMIFGNKVQQFSKLKRIATNLETLPKIRQYENSRRSIKQMCPTSLLKQIKKKTSEQGKQSQ